MQPERPVRPTTLGNGWKPVSLTPFNTPSSPQTQTILHTKAENQFATSQFTTDSNADSKAEVGKFGSSQIVVDSASNAGFSTPIGEKMETTITESSEFHSVTSLDSKVTLSPSSEESIGEIVHQIVNDTFNRNAAATSEAKTTTVATASSDKKIDEKSIKSTQSERDSAPESLSSEVITFPESFAKFRTATSCIETRSYDPAKSSTLESERPTSTFEAFKNFVSGMMTSAVNAISPHSEKTEPKFNEESNASKSNDRNVPESNDNQVITTEVIENASNDLGLSSPGLVKELISSKVELIPSGSTGENELVSSTVTKESSTFVELPNGFRKEETTSTVTVISTHSSSEFKTSSHVVSNDGTTNGPVIAEISTSAYDPIADKTSSEAIVTEIKSDNEEGAFSSLETTTSSIYYEVSNTPNDRATEDFTNTRKDKSHHIYTDDSSVNTHSYSSFDED